MKIDEHGTLRGYPAFFELSKDVEKEFVTMAKDHGSSIKDDETYEELRKQGASKQKAARIANAQANDSVDQKGTALEDRTKDELYEQAQDIGIEGRSDMTKDELIKAIRNS